MPDPTSTASAPHYTWPSTTGPEQCDGWRLVTAPGLSVIQERMPPGTAETRHRHARTRQFFYVLSGAASLEVNGVTHPLTAQHGLEVPPGSAHQMRNDGPDDLHFLVISDGASRDDRAPA